MKATPSPNPSFQVFFPNSLFFFLLFLFFSFFYYSRFALHVPSSLHTPRSSPALRAPVKCIMQHNLIPRSYLFVRYVHKHIAVGSLGMRLNSAHTVLLRNVPVFCVNVGKKENWKEILHVHPRTFKTLH